MIGTILAVALTLAAPQPSLRVLTFGGGPQPEMNQVAIESNVRYVSSLLPPSVQHTVLFTDGGKDKPLVQFEVPPAKMTPGERVVRGLFGDGPGRGESSPWLQYRPTILKQIDGPLVATEVKTAFEKVSAESPKVPLLLYFTGHGSPQQPDFENNYMDLWKSGQLHVDDLKESLAKIPASRRVTMVMVQCHSGAFARLVLDPALQDRPLCGFFAAPKERVAAGCTPSVLEEDYHDFTGYFFAALTGKDRMGRTVPKADYNKDGKVGGDEAMAYAQMTDESIDVPICTSDVLLRKGLPGAEIDMAFADLPFSKVYAMASPLQKKVLDALSQQLGPLAQGEDRISVARKDLENRGRGRGGFVNMDNAESQKLQDGRRKLQTKFPGLRSRNGADWKTAAKSASDYLTDDPDERKLLEEGLSARGEAEKKSEADEVFGARMLRLLRTCKTVYLEDKLRKSGDKALIARFEKLKKLEAASPLQ